MARSVRGWSCCRRRNPSGVVCGAIVPSCTLCCKLLFIAVLLVSHIACHRREMSGDWSWELNHLYHHHRQNLLLHHLPSSALTKLSLPHALPHSSPISTNKTPSFPSQIIPSPGYSSILLADTLSPSVPHKLSSKLIADFAQFLLRSFGVKSRFCAPPEEVGGTMNVLLVTRRAAAGGMMDRQSLNEVPLVRDYTRTNIVAKIASLIQGHLFTATYTPNILSIQIAQLQQLPRTRVTVADLSALPLDHQAALAHASHVMVCHSQLATRTLTLSSPNIRLGCTAQA